MMPGQQEHGGARVVEVVAGRPGSGNYWRDFWDHRELLFFLTWRDIIVRYRQTVVGVAWAVLRPLLITGVMVIVFSKLAGLGSDGLPYSLVVLTGLLGWQLFATGLTGASSSLVNNVSLISKVYFPRLVIPASSILASLVDFVIFCGLLAVFMVWFNHPPGWQVVFLPVLLLLTLATTLGAGLWFGALNVRYRDFNNIVPILLQVGMYLSPVGFRSELIPERWRLLYSLNPMAGLLDGFRWALLGDHATVYWPGFLVSAAVAGLLLASGVWFFRKAEQTFADFI